MITMLKFSVRSHFRMWVRTARDRNHRNDRRYQRELCGFNPERWKRAYGKEQFGNGIDEIFSNP